MAVLCQKLILGTCRIICIEFDVSDALRVPVMKMLFFVELNAIPPPHVAVVFSLDVPRTIPVIKDVPDDTKVVFLSHIVFYFLRLRQT